MQSIGSTVIRPSITLKNTAVQPKKKSFINRLLDPERIVKNKHFAKVDLEPNLSNVNIQTSAVYVKQEAQVTAAL